MSRANIFKQTSVEITLGVLVGLLLIIGVNGIRSNIRARIYSERTASINNRFSTHTNYSRVQAITGEVGRILFMYPLHARLNYFEIYITGAVSTSNDFVKLQEIVEGRFTDFNVHYNVAVDEG